MRLCLSPIFLSFPASFLLPNTYKWPVILFVVYKPFMFLPWGRQNSTKKSGFTSKYPKLGKCLLERTKRRLLPCGSIHNGLLLVVCFHLAVIIYAYEWIYAKISINRLPGCFTSQRKTQTGVSRSLVKTKDYLFPPSEETTEPQTGNTIKLYLIFSKNTTSKQQLFSFWF